MCRENALDLAISFRESLIAANGCTFKATVTADYQNVCYTFSMNCKMDKSGTVTFEVVEPDSIQGITGCISSVEGKLIFDDQVLLFPTLLEGQVTPVCAPWLFINALRSGYIKGCSKEIDGCSLQVNDSYAENAMLLDVRIADGVPAFCEIIWNNRRVMTLDVEDFIFM